MTTPPAIAAAMADDVQRVFGGVPASVLCAFHQRLIASNEAIRCQPLRSFAKPYGTNYILDMIEGFGVSCACFGVGHQTSYHRHLRRTEFYCVRAGLLEIQWQGRSTVLGPREWAHSRPGEPHRLRNAGPEVLEVVELFSPPLLDDKERLDDSYGRCLGAVTCEQ